MSPRATPRVEQYAEQAVESACHLADMAGPEGWSAAAADDALEAIETLAGALSTLGPEVAKALATVTAATADVRQRLGLADDKESAAAVPVSVPRNARRPQRRGLGPGFKGIRPDS